MICKKCGQRETQRKFCKVCDFKNRHQDKINKIIDGQYWAEDEIDYILDNILYRKIEVINELVDNLNNKSLKDLVDLLSGDLRIGNAPQRVKLNCYSCGAELIRPLNHFYHDRVYCNLKCRDMYKTNELSGKNSPFYKREHTCCTNCGKPIDITPANYNKQNEFGDSHHFCSQQCYWEYRSKYYVGGKHPQYGVEKSEEAKEKSREVLLKNIQEGKIPQTLTKPHKTINQLLDEHDIEYINEYPCKYYSIDIYVQKYNLMIEIMGDYWHGSPLKYSYNNLNKQQLKDIKQDKSKHTYIKRYYGNEILYLWEYDINHNIDLCWNLIQLYIKQDGVLENYQSFNYFMDNNTILLRDDIIIPYFYNTESLTTAG